MSRSLLHEITFTCSRCDGTDALRVPASMATSITHETVPPRWLILAGQEFCPRCATSFVEWWGPKAPSAVLATYGIKPHG